MSLNLKQIFFLLCTLPLFGQVQEEVNPPENIKSIIFKGPTDDQFPIVELGESFRLEFDDTLANEQDYYYRIIHCDYDWTPSQLLKSQYLNGSDNQRIIDYGNSYSTLQSYSNYRLSFPNENVKFRVGGNYLIEIYNSYNELQFSRRFIIYKNLVTVGGIVKRSRDFDFINEKQSVQFSINPGDFSLVNPKKEVKIAILQNYHWPTALYNIKPQFTLGSQLVYKYDQETSFYGGNEFLNFDTSDLRAPSAHISSIDFTELYNHYLFADAFRNNEPYTYFPDRNGDFFVRTLQGDDVSREAEYSHVYFSIPYDELIGLDDIYVYGKFNNYALNKENKMIYNEEKGMMELILKMKQGFYNYKYVIQREDKTIELNASSGNFHFTENNYLILVYYRIFGDMYDSVIGIGATSSRNISN